MLKRIFFLQILSIWFIGGLLGQEASFDWKLHNVGKIRQVVTNRGGLNAKGDPNFDYPGLINCEHPPNSGMEHITNTGLWIGAVYDNIRSVTLADGESGQIHECFPTSEPWDTVWEVKKREVADIPYWPGYTGVSDQDFVCRYNDYGPISLRTADHRPLYIDVIMTTYAWANPPLDEIIVIKYYIIPTRYDLEDVYVGMYMNGNVGYVNEGDFGLDDESFYNSVADISFARDIPGGPDGSATMVGEKFYPQGNPKKTTFLWWNGVQGAPPERDNDKYINMSSGVIMEDQISTGDGTKSMTAFGPYASVAVGDTLHFTVAIILGESESNIVSKGEYLSQLMERDYKVPSAPPSPSFRIIPSDKTVTLDWTPQPGGVNPEEYEDPDRADGILKPFEGYRVYKSTVSSSGPWTLLDQYDKIDDYGQNTGLSYSYTDRGLLNNIEYYYTVTSFTMPDDSIDFPELESSFTVGSQVAVPGTPPPETIGKVAVVPNPYRGDVPYYSYDPPWEKPPVGRKWMEQDRRVQFINLPERCEIRIYTLAGDLVDTIYHENPSRGYEDWNLTSSVGQAISSGLYLFTVEDKNNNQVQVGKFVVIK